MRFVYQGWSSDVPETALGKALEGLGGLKLDEIDAASSFLMLQMARDGFKWPVKTSQNHNVFYISSPFGEPPLRGM